MDQTEFPTVESQHRMVEQVKSALALKDRRTRRALLPRHRVGIMQAPGSARVRSGIRTGRTKHFNLWMADLRMKSALQKTSTADLADHTATPALASSAFALMFVAGLRSVWDVTSASLADILAIEGIGPKKAEAVEDYLLDHKVKPSWTTK